MATDPNETLKAGTRADREPQSTVELLRKLVNELSMLFRQEVALVRAEITESLPVAKSGFISAATGAAALVAGLLLLSAAAVLALAQVIPPWLAALIVGVGVGLCGYVLLLAGTRKLKPSVLTPTKSPESLRRDAKVLTRRRHEQLH
jgi:hypothetical protein